MKQDNKQKASNNRSSPGKNAAGDLCRNYGKEYVGRLNIRLCYSWQLQFANNPISSLNI